MQSQSEIVRQRRKDAQTRFRKKRPEYFKEYQKRRTARMNGNYVADGRNTLNLSTVRYNDNTGTQKLPDCKVAKLKMREIFDETDKLFRPVNIRAEIQRCPASKLPALIDRIK